MDISLPEKLYLDLMKKTLTYSLWPEPPVAIKQSVFQPAVKRTAVKLISGLLKSSNYVLARTQNLTDEERQSGLAWPGCADTMIGQRRLDNLQYCVETVIKNKIAGDLIETGVWRGGACIFMRAILAAYGIKDRRVFVADSFEGLP